MRDSRVDEYARLLVERSICVQPGWQVFLRSTPLARPLVDAVQEQIARKSAWPILQISWDGFGGTFAREAPLELLATAAPLQLRMWEECDAFISIQAPENVREGSDLSPERREILQRRAEPLRRRQMGMNVPWVVCEYPTNAAAQEAGMTLTEFEEFVYGAVLRDWDLELVRMSRIAEVFDGAEEVRIFGEGTDLRLSLAGRRGTVEDGHINMPGGEVFYSPVEDSVEGEVTFCEFPALYFGHEVTQVRFVFRGGTIVDASAQTGEEFLLRTLDTDAGARILGELGIGCNPGIQRFTRNVAFDEKIDGTIHLAVGNSYSSTGGKNVSAIHWDMVKDLRNGGQLYADGVLVQDNGRWVETELAA